MSIRKKNPYHKLCTNAENRKHSIVLQKLENYQNRNLFNTNEDRHKKPNSWTNRKITNYANNLE